MQLEELGLSEQCVMALKRGGLHTAEEIVEFLETYEWENEMHARWLRYFDIILEQLKHSGYWSRYVGAALAVH